MLAVKQKQRQILRLFQISWTFQQITGAGKCFASQGLQLTGIEVTFR